MPRQSQRLQRKRAQQPNSSTTSSGSAPKRPSQIVPRAGSTSQVTPHVDSLEISEAMISRLAVAVTERLQERQQFSSSTNLTPAGDEDRVVAEIPAVSVPTLPASASIGPLQGAIASHLGALPSVNSSSPSGEPSDPFISASLPIDARVSDKIRQKIWDNEYVDLGILLVRPASQNKFQITLGQPELGRQPSFCIEPAEKPRRITTIDQWLNAFHVFIGVYTAKYPQDSPELIKYCSLIRDLAERGHNWLFYDENFRFMRQSRVSSLPWGAIHTELWLRSHPPPSKVPSNANRNSRSVPSLSFGRRDVPFGYCFNFHRGDPCRATPCAFKHTCFQCGGKHRVSSCTFRAPGNERQPISAKSKPSNATNTSKSS